MAPHVGVNQVLLALIPGEQKCGQPVTKGSAMTDSEASAREAIAATVAGVAHFIDHKDWRELRRLYSDHVQTDYTSLFGGEVQEQRGDDLIEAWRKLLTPIVTQHLLGPITVEVKGSVATAR